MAYELRTQSCAPDWRSSPSHLRHWNVHRGRRTAASATTTAATASPQTDCRTRARFATQTRVVVRSAPSLRRHGFLVRVAGLDPVGDLMPPGSDPPRNTRLTCGNRVRGP